MNNDSYNLLMIFIMIFIACTLLHAIGFLLIISFFPALFTLMQYLDKLTSQYINEIKQNK